MNEKIKTFSMMFGAILDINGIIALDVIRTVRAKSRKRPRTIEEAFNMDMNAIGNDMRKALNAYGESHRV